MNLNVKIVLVFIIAISILIGVVILTDSSSINSKIPLSLFENHKIIDANNQFSLDMYSELIKENDDNVFLSPTSISSTFAILYEGANNNTESEIGEVFGFVSDDSKRRDGFAALQQLLNPKNEKYNLQLANALWIADGFELLPDYIDTAITYYDSKVESLDFSSKNAVNTINAWTSEKTNGKIEKIFDNLDSETRLVITNAIYFKGTWVNQFESEKTRDMEFWATEDEFMYAPTMNLPRTDLNYARDENVQILELPYDGSDISMLVFLPEHVNGLKSLEESLTVEKISHWRSELEPVKIAVSLPKFTMDTSYDLKKPLLNLGMVDAFDNGASDFSGMTDSQGLFVAKVVHKAFVDVNEEGTEAAAATGIAMLQSGLSFRANHPFMFTIQDNNTGQILFIGRVMDPTV